ncbi:uncharacterized protein LOC131935939 [Physella acuta]|uniref:uncharacterized protein LOC131935939 n=1 Tax=Physella acuta TaxID=109671 RepID=UPI0027DDBACF|nr:uncharacterized protein LOC131935939 [Physella acuta]
MFKQQSQSHCVSQDDEVYEQPQIPVQDYYEDMSAPQSKPVVTRPPFMAEVERTYPSNASFDHKKPPTLEEIRIQLNKKFAAVKPEPSSAIERKISDPHKPVKKFNTPDRLRRKTTGGSYPYMPDVPPKPPNQGFNQSPDLSDEEDDWAGEFSDEEADDNSDNGDYVVPDGGIVDDHAPAPPPSVKAPPVPPSKRTLPPLPPEPGVTPVPTPVVTQPEKPVERKTDSPVNKSPNIIEIPNRFNQGKQIPAESKAKPAPPSKPPKPAPFNNGCHSASDESSSGGSITQDVRPTPPQKYPTKVLVLPPHAPSKFPQVKPPVPQIPSSRDDNIYDDGTTEVLSSQPWFHDSLDRTEVESKLKRLNMNGAFLVRPSKKDHPYTLVVIADGKPYNLPLRKRDDNKFAIGKYKPDEVAFSSVVDLIEHHKSNNIILAKGGTVRLTRTPEKS